MFVQKRLDVMPIDGNAAVITKHIAHRIEPPKVSEVDPVRGQAVDHLLCGGFHGASKGIHESCL
jgi:hypothetical protein